MAKKGSGSASDAEPTSNPKRARVDLDAALSAFLPPEGRVTRSAASKATTSSNAPKNNTTIAKKSRPPKSASQKPATSKSSASKPSAPRTSPSAPKPSVSKAASNSPTTPPASHDRELGSYMGPYMNSASAPDPARKGSSSTSTEIISSPLYLLASKPGPSNQDEHDFFQDLAAQEELFDSVHHTGTGKKPIAASEPDSEGEEEVSCDSASEEEEGQEGDDDIQEDEDQMQVEDVTKPKKNSSQRRKGIRKDKVLKGILKKLQVILPPFAFLDPLRFPSRLLPPALHLCIRLLQIGHQLISLVGDLLPLSFHA
ncbi:hypothetical protein DFH05DRAFT_1464530 [Lentinula detonsa]|uniref:Uncharacterized protein n=1 Tax=Lentinula detonsa TaxID=2804962 RepID=A0A9W8NQ98_9AGAR|nr:hypothetical protein DFH05DRAFT_1464530 [Lentinula detonsa]